MEAELRIAAVLSRRPFSGLTTYQLAKQVGKSYSYTYLAVQRMVKAGMIHQQTVGHAVLCSLVLHSAQVQAFLSLHAAQQKQKNEIPELLKDIQEQLPGIYQGIAILSFGGKPYLLSSSEIQSVLKKKLPNHQMLIAEEVNDWKKEIDFESLNVHHNASLFWAIVGGAHA